MSGSQLTLDVIEHFGSNQVQQVGNHIVSLLEGELFCDCDWFKYQGMRKGEPCRHILQKVVELKDARIRQLEEELRKTEEGVRKHRGRGMGANYQIRKLSKVHVMVLRVLCAHRDGRPRKWIRHELGQAGLRCTDTALGGRVSELLGNGYLSMSREHRVICDIVDGSMQFRFDEQDGHLLPLYFLTAKGWDYLREKGLVP